MYAEASLWPSLAGPTVSEDEADLHFFQGGALAAKAEGEVPITY